MDQWPILSVLKSRSSRLIKRPDFILFVLPADFFTPMMIEELQTLQSFCADRSDLEADRQTGIFWRVDPGYVVVYRRVAPPTDRDLEETIKEEDRAALAADIVNQHFERLATAQDWSGVMDEVWDEVLAHVERARDGGGRISKRAQARLAAQRLRVERPDQGLEFLARVRISKITGRAFHGKLALVPIVPISTERGTAYMTFQADPNPEGDNHRFIAYHSHLLIRMGERRFGNRNRNRDDMQEHLLLELASAPDNRLWADKATKTAIWFVPGGALLGSRLSRHTNYFFTFITEGQLGESQRRLRDDAVPYRLSFWRQLPTQAAEMAALRRDLEGRDARGF